MTWGLEIDSYDVMFVCNELVDRIRYGVQIQQF